jgi:hypothetical protein
MWCVIEKPGWEESAFYAVNHVWAKFDFKGGLDSMRWHAVWPQGKIGLVVE